MQAKNERLEELECAAAGLAHETKNPLGIIHGLAQKLGESPELNDQSRKMVSHIVDEAEVTVARLGNFLAFAKLRNPQIIAEGGKRLLNRLEFALMPDFEEKGVELQFNCDDIQIMTDSEMFSQLCVNLLLNSLHACETGGTVNVELKKAGQGAVLTVQDNGSGINPDKIEDIFKPYISETPGGHGLGLAIVKRIIDDFSWDISVDSEPGRGTVFKIIQIKTAEKA